MIQLVVVLMISSVERTEGLDIHRSMLQYYEEMTRTGAQSTAQRITSLPGLVRSEDPCRVVFNLPKKYVNRKLRKVELQVKVSDRTIHVTLNNSQAVLMVNTGTLKIIAVKLLGMGSLQTVDMTRFVTRGKSAPAQDLEIWIGYERNERKIECDNSSEMRPTLFLHYKNSLHRFPRSNFTSFITKRGIRSKVQSNEIVKADIRDTDQGPGNIFFRLDYSKLGFGVGGTQSLEPLCEKVMFPW